jgi:hypothetical protein
MFLKYIYITDFSMTALLATAFIKRTHPNIDFFHPQIRLHQFGSTHFFFDKGRFFREKETASEVPYIFFGILTDLLPTILDHIRSQDNLSASGQPVSRPRPPQQEAGVITTTPRRSICFPRILKFSV